MKKLSIRNKTLLLFANSGTFVERYDEIVESLYMDEADEIFEFCKFIDEKVGGAGYVNIDTLFLAFKNPEDKGLQEFVNVLRKKILELKRR
jgi:hypothetical protein